MNSDDEEILDYSNESDSDNEEDADVNDSKEEGKGKKKPRWLGKREAGSQIHVQQMVSHGPKLSLQFYSEPDELDYFLHFHKILSKQFYYQQPIPMDKNLEVFSNMSAEYTGTQIMMTSFQH